MRRAVLRVLSARRSLSFFLAAVVSLAFWQVWLTWRLMEQDRRLELQRSRELLVGIADLAAAQVARTLGNWELSLRGSEALPPAAPVLAQAPTRSTFVIICQSGIVTYPRRPLLFLPDASIPAAAISQDFDRADEIELREQQYSLALRELQHLAAQPRTRPEALLRIARIQRKAGILEAALQTYGQLARETSNRGVLNPSGMPYALLAANARCRILSELGRTETAKTEADSIRRDLSQGRWPLRRESFEYQWSELAKFENTAEPPAQPAFEFAVLVSQLFDRWQSSIRSGTSVSGREALPDSSLLMWDATAARLSAMLVPPDWLASILQRTGSLSDVRWTFVGPGPIEESNYSVTRSLADMQIPGRIQFSSVHPPSGIASSRRLLWLTGVVLMVVLVVVSGYAVQRAISRELQVATLQSDFVSAVSHEFRSPLTTLRTITELLVQNRITDEARRQKSYAFLDHETGRLHRMVEALLDFGRMESGRRQYRMEPHDVFQLVRVTVAEFSEEAAASGFRVETNLPPAPANVQADEEAFRRAVRNLLENALKYSPESRTVWVYGTVTDSVVSISVRDEGMGIDPAEQRDIFQKFVRGTAAKRAGIKGTGIGLSMVHQISKALGGEVRVESKVGIGSTFTMVLPLAGS